MIGFVGLGKMGGGLARNLLKNHEVVVYDVRPEVVQEFVAAGAKGSKTVAELASEATTLFTSLPLPADVTQLLFGSQGIASHLPPGTTVIDVSTIDPVTARQLEDGLVALGHEFLACPLGKGPAQAALGTEPIFAGGNQAVFLRCKALLEEIGDPVHYLGGVEQSTAFKLISNHIGMTNMAILAEGLAFGIKSGIPLDLLVRLLADTGANSHQLQLRGPWIVHQDYAPRFAVNLTVKDLRLAVELARQLAVPVPLGAESLRLFQTVQGCGWGEEDTAAVFKVLAGEEGVSI
ncbi:MAG: NAD(P)-dependent oxidoreductase [Thermaerobacter sp.]|nr:NAD(P)-dependent oxidoreductase [Thermaerobacter sp.]